MESLDLLFDIARLKRQKANKDTPNIDQNTSDGKPVADSAEKATNLSYLCQAGFKKIQMGIPKVCTIV